MIHSVLFDLDGTLADTAPDLAIALNKVLKEQGLEPLSLETIRYEVSNGATALVRLGFQLEPDHPQFEPLRLRLLEHYASDIARYTRLFEGMHELLDNLERKDIAWGIVTNKPSRFTDPLLAQLGVRERAACVVSGDTLEKKKPHPEPILYACKIIGCQPGQCVYVGDALRDIQAGQRAGTKTVVALFGYILDKQMPQGWGADALVDHPMEIWQWLQNS
jgi:phosphoglycolate phosphatase